MILFNYSACFKNLNSKNIDLVTIYLKRWRFNLFLDYEKGTNFALVVFRVNLFTDRSR